MPVIFSKRYDCGLEYRTVETISNATTTKLIINTILGICIFKKHNGTNATIMPAIGEGNPSNALGTCVILNRAKRYAAHTGNIAAIKTPPSID